MTSKTANSSKGIGVSAPVASATTPFWRSQKHALDEHRSSPKLPAKQDIVIIGAGFAGAACAYYISKQSGSMPATTILEAREACSGATARNGGHLRPDSIVTFAKFAPKLGLKVANDIAVFEIDNCKAVKELVEAEDVQCQYADVTSASVFLDEGQGQEAKKQHAEWLAQGYDMFNRFKFYEGQEAEERSGVPGAKVLMTFPAACLWPYKLVTHLLSVAVDAGVNLQTNAPVASVSPTPDVDGYWTLSTTRGDVRAKKVIFATNGYTSHLLPQYKEHIIPVRGICSHIKSSRSTTNPPISSDVKTMGIKYSPGHQDYLASQTDGSIVVGGAWKVIRPGPRNDWFNVADDSKLVPIAADYYNGFMERTFKSWKDNTSEVDYLWTGIMGYCSDDVPHVGKVDSSRPGLYVCAGFNGHGMPQVLLCAKGTVKMALEGCDFADTGVPAVFETSPKR